MIPFITIILGIFILDEPFHLGIQIGLPLMIISLFAMGTRGSMERKVKADHEEIAG